MSTKKGNIARKSPEAIEVEAGKTYYWCACGLSKNQPFCDGSHKVTDFTPKSFTPEKSGKVYLCMCKQTGNPPFCDGTHNKL